jgi:uncharacterized repeat protein (TIGR03803 family)
MVELLYFGAVSTQHLRGSYIMKIWRFLAILCTVWASTNNVATAQAVVPGTVASTLYSFGNDDCVAGTFNYPQGGGALVQATNGKLYGTTYGGGICGYGTVFSITNSGDLITLHRFCTQTGCPDGSFPYFGVVLATDSNLYGITDQGGAHGHGTIFQMTPTGRFITFYSFCAQTQCLDGSDPYGGLVLGSDGNLYGTTRNGGTNGGGTIFRVTLGGSLTTLYSFTGGSDGAKPAATLVQANDGNFYGTTYGGASNNGTIFKITPTGTLTTLHTFNGTDGGASESGLMQAADGNLYGTSKFGGASQTGTVFKITTAGNLTTLYNFTGQDGAGPNSALMQAADGNLYGTTEGGGTSGHNGTIFKIDPSGQFLKLYEFPSSTFGNNLYGGLVQATDGGLYGQTQLGGSAGDGMIFRFCTSLCPFVQPFPTSASPGTVISLLGSDLAGATSVTFNGTVAAFQVVGLTEIRAYVPTNATGTIQVTLPGGTLSSNVPFTVNAASACSQWNVSGSWAVAQSNGFNDIFSIQQNGVVVTGTATDGGAPATIQGTMQGSEFLATVYWSTGGYGLYSATMTEDGKLTNGSGFNLSNPASTATWTTRAVFTCSATSAAR